jgi:ABC-type nitrate/sulfonate/bicarbonate transport system substrate-binding protein
MKTSRRTALAGAAAAALIGSGLAASTAQAQQAPLKVIVFPGLSNLAILSAQHNGFFAKRNIQIELINTPNSTELRNGLAEGRYQIAHAAVDNAVAQIENNKVEASIVMGGDGGLNLLITQPEITAIEQFKGKTVVVDAPNTAYAFLLYKMLKVKGMERGKDYKVNPVGGTGQRLDAMKKDKENVGGMMNPPFSIRAVKQDGFKSLGSPAAIVGPYQAGGVWVLTKWGKENQDLLVRYLQANIEGIRWATNPANKAAAAGLLADRLKLDADTAMASLEMGLDAKAGGFARDLAFDMEGFRTVLSLRAEMEGQWGGKPPAPDKFLDMSYYQKALAGMK